MILDNEICHTLVVMSVIRRKRINWETGLWWNPKPFHPYLLDIVIVSILLSPSTPNIPVIPLMCLSCDPFPILSHYIQLIFSLILLLPHCYYYMYLLCCTNIYLQLFVSFRYVGIDPIWVPSWGSMALDLCPRTLSQIVKLEILEYLHPQSSMRKILNAS